MNEHQKQLWQSMIHLIQIYLDDETEDFINLVGKLEGALDASEIRDETLVNKWYDLWTPLEKRRAIDGNNTDITQAKKELKAMKDFLIKVTI